MVRSQRIQVADPDPEEDPVVIQIQKKFRSRRSSRYRLQISEDPVVIQIQVADPEEDPVEIQIQKDQKFRGKYRRTLVINNQLKYKRSGSRVMLQRTSRRSPDPLEIQIQ